MKLIPLKSFLREREENQKQIANRQREAMKNIFENPSAWSKEDFRAICKNIRWIISILNENPKNNSRLREAQNKIKECRELTARRISQDFGYKIEIARNRSTEFPDIAYYAIDEKNEKLRDLILEQNEILCSALEDPSLKFKSKAKIFELLEKNLNAHFPTKK